MDATLQLRRAGSAVVRRGFSAVEILVAAAITAMMMGTTMGFMRMGQQTVVKVTDHADARMEALRVLEVINTDLERLMVGDAIDDPYASVLDPFKRKWDGQNGSFGFYAFHHFEYFRASKRIQLVAGWIDYETQKRFDGGVDLLRNGKRVNILPLHKVKIEFLDSREAEKLRISPKHCIVVTIYPMGIWDKNNANVWSEANAIKRMFHLSNVESRYACLLSVKRAIQSGDAAYAPKDERFQQIVKLLPDPPAVANQPPGPPVILAWLQPQEGLVADLGQVKSFFDDATADQNKMTGYVPPNPGPPIPNTSKIPASHTNESMRDKAVCADCHVIGSSGGSSDSANRNCTVNGKSCPPSHSSGDQATKTCKLCHAGADCN